ncbi:MAG: SH3 domain-containing protein [Ruminococcus sp.]|nr:SH3 domain-containing protein [Ruminococcus sp.]
MSKKTAKLFIAALMAINTLALEGCGLVEMIGPQEETTTLFTTTVKETRRSVHTTKTAYFGGEVDADDEDYTGYTTTTAMESGTLENEFSREDEEQDFGMAATRRTEAKTFYTIPEHNGTTAKAVTVSAEATTTTRPSTIVLGEDDTTTRSATTTAKKTTTTTTKATSAATTTTAFNADSLFEMDEGMKFTSEVRYKVTSDTTYLNLRYGPSKRYNVILQIPDGSTVSGRGLATERDGTKWVCVEYEGEVGWVMHSLLTMTA